MARDFTVELKLIVQRKCQTMAVKYSLNAAIQDVEPEEGVSFNVSNVLLATPLKLDNLCVQEHFALLVSRFVQVVTYCHLAMLYHGSSPRG
eukprot:1431800-Amphidinium_carterae.1